MVIFWKKPIFWIFFLILLAIPVVSYFFKKPLLSLLPYASQKQSTTTPQFKLSCPIPEEFCKTGRVSSYNGQPALIYDIPPSTAIRSIAEVIDSKRFVIQPYQKEDPIGLYQSTIVGDDCYTLTYLVPPQTIIKKIDLLPLEKGTLIATTSAELIEVNGNKTNLIVQLQKRPLDNSDPAKPSHEKCPVINLKSTDFGEYQSLTNML